MKRGKLKRRLPLTAAWGFATVIFLGCAGTPPQAFEETSKTPRGFPLGPEDVIDVVVWKNPDLSRQVVVRPDGMISMPLIGDLQANGLTAEALAERIAEGLKEYMEEPSVTVHVLEV